MSSQIETNLLEQLSVDEVIVATHASAPEWIKDSGIKVDQYGFILVNNYLQSLNRENVFAAGDIGHVLAHPRPKAGVIAVRQGPPARRSSRQAVPQFPDGAPRIG